MRKYSLWLFCLLCIIVCYSCSKGKKITTTGNADYLIVGQVGGFIAYSTPFYLLTNDSLAEDTTCYNNTLPVPTDVTKFNFNYLLPSARLDTVKYLLSSIPAELFNNNNADIGAICPDFGYTDVRASVNGIPYKWSFECDLSKSSPAVQQFVKTLRVDF